MLLMLLMACPRRDARVCRRFFYRTVSIVARFLSAVGLIAKVAGAVFEFQSADEFDYAASSCNASGAHRNATSILVDQANLAAAIQSSNEAVALLITSLAFCILVPLSVTSFRRAESVAATTRFSPPTAIASTGKLKGRALLSKVQWVL